MNNVITRFVVVAAIASVVVLALAWVIRQIYFIINDLDNWALWVLNNPVVAGGFGIASGLVYLVVSKFVKQDKS